MLAALGLALYFYVALVFSSVQQIGVDKNIYVVKGGDELTLSLSYNVDDNDSTLSGLGFRLHYNSSQLSFGALVDLLTNNLIQQDLIPQNDIEDYDNDPTTDKYISVAWASIDGDWPNVSLPVQLYSISFSAAGSFDGASSVHLSSTSVAVGYTFSSPTINVVVDNTPPVISKPISIVVTAQDPSGIPKSELAISAYLSSVVANDNYDGRTFNVINNAPDIFPLGDTVVTFQAMDTAGNVAVDQATITVISEVDTDGDGLPDEWENLYGLNLADPSDALGNSDSDSLTDKEEYLAGTSPLTADTDGDGVNDDIDLFPLDVNEWLDSDGDGVGDNSDSTPYPPAGTINLTSSVVTVSEDASSLILTLERTNGTYGAVTVDYATQDGSAKASVDYQPAVGTVIFNDGESSKSITLNVIDDSDYDPNEVFSLVLSNAQGGASLGAQLVADITITDNDPAPPSGALVFSESNYSAGENSGSLSITVYRVNGDFGEVSVDYSSVDMTAVAGSDYQVASGTLSFADGVTAQTFTVAIKDDSVYEGDEFFRISLNNVQGGANIGAESTVQVTIIENDPPPPTGLLEFKSASYMVTEDMVAVALVVTRSGGSRGEITVNYSTSSNTAVAGIDFQGSSGNLVFPDGVTEQTIVIPLLDDQDYEGDEVFNVSLSGDGSTLGSIASTQVVIQDNESAPSAGVLQFSGASYAVDEGGASVLLTVLRINGSYGDISVDYTTVDNTATAGFDYQNVMGRLSFADGETVQTISVPILDDRIYEGDERFDVSLSNVQGGAALGSIATATVNITDNETVPDSGSFQFSGDIYKVNEGDGAVQISIMRTGGAAGEAFIDYSTLDGAAISYEDFQPIAGTLVFSDGQSSKIVTVSVFDDQTVEGNESFFLKLANPVGATLSTSAQATVQILDNDSNINSGGVDSSGSGGGGGGSFDLYELALLVTLFGFVSRSKRERKMSC